MFISIWWEIFCRDTAAPQMLAFVNLDCIMAGFGW